VQPIHVPAEAGGARQGARLRPVPHQQGGEALALHLIDDLRAVTQHYLFAVGLVTLLVVLFLPDGLGGAVHRVFGGAAKETS
jgi:hypothetical protein